MSNHLAVAAVTEALYGLLWEAARTVRGAQVYHVRPDEAERIEGAGINIFLYQVVPNAALRNRDLPTRNSAGGLLQRSSAGFDLHYLLSFFGSGSALEPDRLLGATLRTLHETPVLEPLLIERLIQAALAADADSWMGEIDLSRQPEPIRVTPLPMSTDTESRLHTAFNKTIFLLSFPIVASAVVIDGVRIPGAALPVRRAALRPAGPLLSIVTATPRFSVDDTLLVTVRGTLPGNASIAVDGQKLSTTLTEASTLSAVLDEKSAELLHPGTVTISIDEPGVGPLATSAAVLLPVLKDIQVQGRALSIRVVPPPGRNQVVEVLLNAIDGSTNVGILPRHGGGLTFSLAGVAPGRHLVRVVVDGVASDLAWSPTGGFTGPLVKVNDV